MKKLFLLLFSLTTFVVGQTAHQVTVTWTDPNNPTGTSYNVYRQASTCPSTLPTSTSGFTKLNTTPVTVLTYVDTPVVVGTTYCYLVTATNGTVESGPSPDAGATVSPFAPATITVTAR